MVDAKTQGGDTLDKRFGVLIFPKTDSIPQDVIFIEIKKFKPYSNLDSLLNEGLSYNSYEIPYIYFQGLRWRKPNLSEVLQRAEKAKGKLIANKFCKDCEVEILIGNMSFKTDHQGLIWKDIIQEKVILEYNDIKYSFNLYEGQTAILGYPIFFDLLDLNAFFK